MWQMPLDDDYREFIKGTVADIQNIGSGKGGGAVTGAMFIKEFTGDSPGFTSTSPAPPGTTTPSLG